MEGNLYQQEVFKFVLIVENIDRGIGGRRSQANIRVLSSEIVEKKK